MARNNVQPLSYLFCTQVIKPQIIQKPQNKYWHKFPENMHEHQTQHFGRISHFGIASVEKQQQQQQQQQKTTHT